MALYSMVFSKNQVIKLFAPWFYIKEYFQPLGTPVPILGAIDNLGHTWTLDRTLTTSLGSLNKWLEIYFRKYNLELHLFKAFGV